MTSINYNNDCTEPSDNICVTCSSSSIDIKSRSFPNNCISFQTDFYRGMQCIVCKSFICHRCLILFDDAIYPYFTKKAFHPDIYPYIKSLHVYATENIISKSFIGHCCLLKTSSHRFDSSNKNMGNFSNYSFDKSKNIINNQQETDSSNKNNQYIDKKIHLGGCIVYEQCRVILPCSFKFIDCMALAKEENLPAITHFVLDEFYSRDLIFTGFVIKSNLPPSWNFDIKLRAIKIPYNNCSTKTVSYIYQKCYSLDNFI